MSSKGKPLFDLNEPATEDDEETDGVYFFQPQRAIPSTTHTSDLFIKTTNSPCRIINNNAFSHASSVSGFQPFVRPKVVQPSENVAQASENVVQASENVVQGPENVAQASRCVVHKSEKVVHAAEFEEKKRPIDVGSVVEKEEGEWSDAEGSSPPEKSTPCHDDKSEVKPMAVLMDQRDSDVAANTSSIVDDVKDENSNHGSLGLDGDSIDRKSSDSQEDSLVAPKQKDVKGVEAIHALKIANNAAKRPKIDHQKEAMLGKKRSRQTMFLNLEDVKQAGTIKTSTPRRQNFPPPVTTRIVKDKQIQTPITKDENGSVVESSDVKSECNNGDMSSGILGRPKRSICSMELSAEDKLVPNQRQSVLKPTKNAQVLGRKTVQLVGQTSVDPKAGVKKLPSKKPLTVMNQYQDTSVERLIREVTNEKFWQHPEFLYFHKKADVEMIMGQT